jgi:hypothetical protein
MNVCDELCRVGETRRTHADVGRWVSLRFTHLPLIQCRDFLVSRGNVQSRAIHERLEGKGELLQRKESRVLGQPGGIILRQATLAR